MALQKEEALLQDEDFTVDSFAAVFNSDEDTISPDLLHAVPQDTRKIVEATGNPALISYDVMGTVTTRSKLTPADITIISDNTIRLKHGEIELVGDSLFIFNALLAYRGRAQRAEEIRALGYKDRNSLLETRLNFRSTIRKLIKSINEAADDTVLLKTGVTKGTRYQFSPNIELADARKAMLLIGENPSYIERERVLTDLCKRFKDHPEVQQKLFSYRNETYSPIRLNTNDELGVYLKEINAYRLLTKEDEVELFGLIEAGFEQYAKLTSLDALSDTEERTILNMVAAREVVFNTNLRLAVKMSQRYWRVKGTLSELDLIQEANFGLAQAIPRMKIEKGFKFSTYASQWIRQAVGRAVANTSREIRIPVHLHEKYAKAIKDVRELTIELGREPSETEIEHATKMQFQAYTELIRHGRGNLVRLNGLLDQDSDTELGDLIARTEFNYEDADESFQDLGVLKQIIAGSGLSDRQLLIIALRFGINDILPKWVQLGQKDSKPQSVRSLLKGIEIERPLTIYAVGDICNVSGERIRQIEIEAMRKLRQAAIKVES